MSETKPRTPRATTPRVLKWHVLSDTDAKRQVCKKCGFETNSEEIYELHEKNCPRV